MTFIPYFKENGVPTYTTETVDLQLYKVNWMNEWKMIWWVNGRMGGWMDGWMDGRTDGRTYLEKQTKNENTDKLIKQRHT